MRIILTASLLAMAAAGCSPGKPAASPALQALSRSDRPTTNRCHPGLRSKTGAHEHRRVSVFPQRKVLKLQASINPGQAQRAFRHDTDGQAMRHPQRRSGAHS